MERIIPSSTAQTPDPELDRLLDPGRFYSHPRDVIADASLDSYEKRAILSSWVSDACAVESMPALRRPPGMREPVPFDEIMDALRSLDGCACTSSSKAEKGNRASAHRLDA